MRVDIKLGFNFLVFLPLKVIEMHYAVPRIIDIHCLTWRFLIFEEYLKNCVGLNSNSIQNKL